MIAKRARVPVVLLLLGILSIASRLMAEPMGCSPLTPALTAAAKSLPGPDSIGSKAFATYLAAVQKQVKMPGLAALAPGRPVPAASAEVASCVLRGYVQARYGEAIVRDLRELVAFQTFVVEGRENWGAPEFLRQRDWLAGRAKALGLTFKDYDGRMEEITLAGPAPALALLTHGDVQGVEGQEWSSPPFEGRRVGERIVGRGTEDDKGPIVACLYTLAALKDSGWPLGKTVRLLIANGEESSWDEIPYYLARAKTPEITVGIDAAYPVTYAQKGYGILTFRAGAPASASDQGAWRVVKIAGGSGLSIIPERGEALVEPLGEDRGEPAARLDELTRLAREWAAAHPPASLTVSPEGDHGDLLKIVAVGHGGHSSAPASGHNALGDLAAFLAQLDLRHDAWGGLATFVGETIGTETDGRSLGIAHHDDAMGDLTASLAFFLEEKDQPVARDNIRVPRGITLEEIKKNIGARAKAISDKTGVPLSVEVELASEPHIAPVDGPVVAGLLAVWQEVTGTAGKPLAIGGGTQARLFPNGVDFGPAVEMEHYRGHGTDEYMTVPELHRVAELTIAAVWKLAR